MITNKNSSYILLQRGFSALELIVVVAVISLLALVALHQFYKLLVDVERSAMELDLSVMRSALSMQVADHFAKSRLGDLEALVSSNPVDLLEEKPDNYLGVISYQNLTDIKKGSWLFNERAQELVYLAKNELYFETSLAPPARARFKVEAVYSEASRWGHKAGITGLILKEQEPYRWLKP